MIKIVRAEEFRRKIVSSPDVSKVVAEILEDVRLRGDAAVKEYEERFDRVKLETLELAAHTPAVSTEYLRMLERAAENIRAFHEKQRHEGFMFTPRDGVLLGQRVIPLDTVGVYVPGGTAAYPSSVLMNVIPAVVAGCRRIVVATPPRVRPEIVAAAKIAGASQVFQMGGAQAVAAMAFGTESVPKVDKITGPGNIYVAEAKRQVFGRVGIDMVAGPSEILIIADKDNNPVHLAADMLAQAEHDKLASAVLITDSADLAEKVKSEVERQLQALPREEIAREAIENNSAIILVENLNDAAKIADDFAPEHLELCVAEPFGFMTRIHNAGSIFLGKNSPEALGDYYAGANHVLPTMGTARFSSPLSVDDFVKKTQYIAYSHDALMQSAGDIEAFAMSEGLQGHARSITVRRHD
ncbi:MAG: histidinol dehydrogenase [Synergistaceae bacterium]|nr:histidinol dehydrogenase [Synergistaceae bacterium]